MAIILSTVLFAAAVITVYMTVWFIVAVLLKRNDVADLAWGLGFVVVAWSVLLYNDAFNTRMVVVAILVTIWGLRLASHILARLLKKPEDYRYQAWRKQWKYFYLRSYFQVFLLQGFLMFLISATAIIISSVAAVDCNWLSATGVAIWVVGFLFEAIGDYQLKQFIKNPKNKGKIMQSGLWRYTRHPNYFGEVTQWWGLWVMAVGVPYGWIALVSPLTITFLILKVSGIPLLEKKFESVPGWKEYKKRTSVFIPLPMKK